MATPVFFYVYILQSMRDNQFYTGYTHDLRQRIKKHEDGMVNATKTRLPIKLVFYEAYLNKFDAIRREDYFKSTKGKQTLRTMIREYLKDGTSC